MYKIKKDRHLLLQYDAENPGRYGGGGEYIVQAGFGWTNGVIMELLNAYGEDFKCDDIEVCSLTSKSDLLKTCLL